MESMQGHKALITGGTKGLGFAVAKVLASKGVDLFLAYRKDEATAKQAQATIENEYGVKCTIFACDLALENQAEILFNEVKKSFNGKLDYYVHNAAATAFKDLLELEAHHVDKTFNLTIKSFILGVKAAVKMMGQGGAIVTVSGMDTLKAVPKHGLLGAAKAALETLTAYYAHEISLNHGKNIRINGVNPGFLRTDSTQKLLGSHFELVNKALSKAVPLKREPTLTEIANIIVFLLSSEASWIVGQTIKIDGGLDFAPIGF